MHVCGSALDCDSQCVTAVLAPAPLPLVFAEAAAAAVLAIARPGDYVSAHLDCDSPLAMLMPVRRLSLSARQWRHGFQKGFGKVGANI